MKEILGSPKNLRQLLLNTKYTIHYYQREYMWGRKQIEELIDDLTSEFLNYYDPKYQREKGVKTLDDIDENIIKNIKNAQKTSKFFGAFFELNSCILSKDDYNND